LKDGKNLALQSYWEEAPLIIGLKNQVKSELAEFGALSNRAISSLQLLASYRFERATNALLD
jgi:hypothetical protein